MANKRKCKHCKEYVSEFFQCNAGVFCDFEHAAAFGMAKSQKDKIKAQNKIKAELNKAEKEAKAIHRNNLKRVRANPRKDALEAAQLLARVSAADDNGYCQCASCGVIQKWNEMDGGHFIAKGSSTFWMLDPRNINPQCKPCNGFAMKHGHAAIAYTSWMIDKYSKDFVDEMVAKAKTKTKRSAQFFNDYVVKAKIEIDEHKKRIGAK